MRGRPRAVRISIDKAQLGILTGQWGAVVTLQRLCLMHRRIIFKLGVSIVVSVAVILFYLVNVPEEKTRSGGRAYRKLVLGSSPEFLLSHLSHELRQKSDQEALNKHVEAMRIHTQISTRSARDAHMPDKVPKPPGRAKVKEGLFEDELGATEEKLKKEPIHLLGGFPQEGGEEGKILHGSKVNTNLTKDDQISQNRKVDHNVLSHSGKEHDFKFESEHLDANIKKLRNRPGHGSPPIHLCVVVCGTRSQETITMLKSASMVTPLNVTLVFHIFAEPEIQKFFQIELDAWPFVQRTRLSYHIYNVTFPDSSTTNAWKKLFKPCASQRLFLPNLLRSVQRLIYVDTDTVFLESLAHLWSMFDDFNSTQLAGLVGEAEAGFAAWYNRFANHPYYGKYGLNSGVMLMDLERLRHTSWLSDMQRLFHQYRLSLPWGDQDLINIYFAFHPDGTTGMITAATIAIVCQRRKVYRFGDDLEFNFLKNLEEDLRAEKHKTSNCWKVSEIFLTQLQFLKDRNREFIETWRKANQKLRNASRQSRAGIKPKDVPHHSVQRMKVEEKRQVAVQEKEKPSYPEENREGDNPPHLHKEKADGNTKERAKKESIPSQTGGKGNEEQRKVRVDKIPLKSREESKSVLKSDDGGKRPSDRNEKGFSHPITLQEDTLDHPRPNITLLKQVKGESLHKEAERSYGKVRADDSVSKNLPASNRGQNSLKVQQASELTHRSGKIFSTFDVHREGDSIGYQDGTRENVLKKGAPKLEKKNGN
ncbi:glucoside xylosyltransferase 1-like [Elysia marginata]|uniref:UDP-D-xylose:beta-D-glucoside alpha-1,3-D-xylosyltransferase n=1 Tax=Elysia marginata TaxID=1093978 RepID=A0AAV4H218_9GAST|nr:glucoside xylosyltransferase 1-like [Elysia marginata]